MDFNGQFSHECIVVGDTVVARFLSFKDKDEAIFDSVRCHILIDRSYTIDHQLIDVKTYLFREAGDSIFYCRHKFADYWEDSFIYDFKGPWQAGDKVRLGGTDRVLEDSVLQQRLLEDGNYYDCYRVFIRTIGQMINGIIPTVGVSRSSTTFHCVTHFIRNGVLIYKNDNIIYPEGYETRFDSPYSENPADNSAVYSLQGIRVGDGKSVHTLTPGIYIQNGKKFVVE